MGCDPFAHPVERELARLFDEHGVAWEYEPHTFVLERNGDGSVREAFTRDFFLPARETYVECTVMRQALTVRKRRKVRKARRAGTPCTCSTATTSSASRARGASTASPGPPKAMPPDVVEADA